MSERQVAWVIEAGAGTYWAGRSHDDFQPDHNDAVRFARRDDAERVRCWLIEHHNHALAMACRASEHVWMGSVAEAVATITKHRHIDGKDFAKSGPV